MRRMRAGRLAAVTLGAALLAGCAGSGGGKKGPSKPKCTPPATASVCFTTNVQPIFNKSCALAGCHAGTPAAQNLDLSSGQSYRAIVGVKAVQQPKLQLVEPMHPERSYLQQKMEGTSSISGVLMPQGCPGTPLNGAQCLDANDLSTISTWITECALQQGPGCP
jgi:hypothetical protein